MKRLTGRHECASLNTRARRTKLEIEAQDWVLEFGKKSGWRYE